MKYALLFLVLFALPVYGQEEWLTTSTVSYPKTPTYIFGCDTVIVCYGPDTVRATMNPYSVPALLDWLRLADSYVKECYDDSTEVGVILYWEADSTNANLLISRREPQYEHHHNPTLSGFMDYLRDKLIKPRKATP